MSLLYMSDISILYKEHVHVISSTYRPPHVSPTLLWRVPFGIDFASILASILGCILRGFWLHFSSIFRCFLKLLRITFFYYFGHVF